MKVLSSDWPPKDILLRLTAGLGEFTASDAAEPFTESTGRWALRIPRSSFRAISI